jgi:WD40 repeat protein
MRISRDTVKGLTWLTGMAMTCAAFAIFSGPHCFDACPQEYNSTVAWSDNGDYLAVGGIEGLSIYDYASQAQVKTIEDVGSEEVEWISANHNAFVLYAFRGFVAYDLVADSASPIFVTDTADGYVRSFSLSPSGNSLVVLMSKGFVLGYELNGLEAQQIFSYPVLNSSVAAAAWNFDDRLLAFVTQDSVVHIWDRSEEKVVYEFAAHGESSDDYTDVTLEWNEQTNLLAIIDSFHRKIIIWDVDRRAEAASLDGRILAWNPNSPSIAAIASADEEISVVDVLTGERIARGSLENGSFMEMAWHSQEDVIALVGSFKTHPRVWLWDMIENDFVILE